MAIVFEKGTETVGTVGGIITMIPEAVYTVTSATFEKKTFCSGILILAGENFALYETIGLEGK